VNDFQAAQIAAGTAPVFVTLRCVAMPCISTPLSAGGDANIRLLCDIEVLGASVSGPAAAALPRSHGFFPLVRARPLQGAAIRAAAPAD
jgi:hypothetical protein